MVELISDGAVLQQNGESIDVDQYDGLKAR